MNAPSTLATFGPAWCARRVPTFNGQFDTHIETGEDYDTITLAQIFTMEPGRADKGKGGAFIPSGFADYNAREHAAQRTFGEFVTLTGDIDHGNHDLKLIESLVKGFCKDAAYLIYSSAHAAPGDMRWRVIIPLQDPLDYDAWYDAQNAFFDFMESKGVEMDRALNRAAQPVYLPNVPDSHPKTGEKLRDEANCPLHYTRATSGTQSPGIALDSPVLATHIAAIVKQRHEDEQRREKLRQEAAARRANAAPREGQSIIDEFNQNNAIADLFTLYGYEQSPRHSDDWRSPLQTSGSYATRIIEGKWISLSASDAGAGIGERCKSGCFGDAYDLYAHFEHGGDHKAAHRALYAERRASQPQPAPPPREEGDPGWQEMPEAPDEPEQMLEAAIEEVETDREMLPFFWFGDAQPNLDANDFVEDLLTEGAMSVVYGPSNCGKTFFVCDLGLHVAWNQKWRSSDVDGGAVVYLSLEGANGVRNRLAAFRKHYQLEGQNIPFIAMPKPISLLDSNDDVQAVIDLTHHIAQETGKVVRMVIVDTLSRAMAGGNENSPEDMTALIGNCDRIKDATGAHICIVHHSGKDEAKGARGHSSLRAATDTEIEIKRDPEANFSTVRIAKQRDMEAIEPFNFALERVELGTNRRGKPVTSCIVTDCSNIVPETPDRNALSVKENQAFTVLCERIDAVGFTIEAGRNMAQRCVVSRHVAAEAMKDAQIIDRNKDNVARAQFSRLMQSLESKGKIGTDGKYIWRAQHGAT